MTYQQVVKQCEDALKLYEIRVSRKAPEEMIVSAITQMIPTPTAHVSPISNHTNRNRRKCMKPPSSVVGSRTRVKADQLPLLTATSDGFGRRLSHSSN